MDLDQPSSPAGEMEVDLQPVVAPMFELDDEMQQDGPELSVPVSFSAPTFSTSSFALSTPVGTSIDVPQEQEMTPIEQQDAVVASEPLPAQAVEIPPVALASLPPTEPEPVVSVEEPLEVVGPSVQPTEDASVTVEVPEPGIPEQDLDKPAGDVPEQEEEEPETPADQVVSTEEPDELDQEPLTRQGSPAADVQELYETESGRPEPQLAYLGNVAMPALPASPSDDKDSIRAPPIKLSYLNETFWLFAEDTEELQTPPKASTSAHPKGVQSVLLTRHDDQRLYFANLASLFERLHEDFPSFAEDEMEMVLSMQDEYGIEVSEDNSYAHVLSLYDLDRIHVGCGREGRLHLNLDSHVRAIYRFNSLARHVAQYTGLLPPIDNSDAHETGSATDNDEWDDLRDEDLPEEAKAALLEDEDKGEDDSEKPEAEADELEEEGVAPEQFDDGVDEGGLADAQTDADEEPAVNGTAQEDESAHRDDTPDAVATPANDFTANNDTKENSVPLADTASEGKEDADETPRSPDAPLSPDEPPSTKSPKRNRDEDGLVDLVDTPTAEAQPESKRLRAA